MPIIAIDTETLGLDARKFLMGCIYDGKKARTFKEKNLMWKAVLHFGEIAMKSKQVLNVYAHNMQYDFYGIADLTDENLTIINDHPFIAKYSKEGKTQIMFLDTMSIYRGSLEELGKIIKKEKSPTPEILKTGEMPKEDEMGDIERYMINDTEIVFDFIQTIKRRLKEDGVNIKRIYTINQIAIQYLLKHISMFPDTEHIFYDKSRKSVIRPRFAKEVSQAYRGGRVECFKTGVFESVTEADKNSLYPYEAMMMRFPDLRTERKVTRPLEIYDKKTLLDKIGVSQAAVMNESNELGLLPIRQEDGNYYPKVGKFFIGTWTNQELKKAEEEGYRILDISWSILYEEGPNPFSAIMPQLYLKRQQGENEIDNFFYKSIMNAGIGKFAQHNVGRKMRVASVEDHIKMKEEGYEPMYGIKENYMYINDNQETKEQKPYYNPIIPAIITANARIRMYDEYRKFDRKDLIYTDTDSIVFLGRPKIEIGKSLGEFKISKKEEPAIIWGNKTISIGGDIKISGISKKDIKLKDFQEGTIESRKMITIKTTSELSEMGGFRKETRDLKKQKEEAIRRKEKLEHQKVYKDISLEKIPIELYDSIAEEEKRWDSKM